MKKNSINLELYEASPEKRQTLRRKYWKSLQDGGELKKARTGIEGLDDILQGGVPVGRGVLVKGRAGAGKTVLMSEFIYRGITEFNENAVDGIFLMNCVERGQGVRQLFNVFKLCGSNHSKDIYKYEITDKGFHLGDKYEI